MSFEAHSLTVPSVLWLGLLPSDIQRFGLNICYFLRLFSAFNWDYILGTVPVVCFGFCGSHVFHLRACTVWHIEF